jgi:flagellar motor switch protein FliM
MEDLFENLSPEEIEKIKQLFLEEEKELQTEEQNRPPSSGDTKQEELNVQPFPFDKLEKLDISQLPLYENALKVFAALLKDELARLGLDVENVEKGKTRLVRYKDLADGWGEDNLYLLFKLKPLPSYGVLVFRIPFLLGVISALLGGDFAPPQVPKREITPSEYTLLRKFFEAILKTLEREISKYYPVKVEIVDYDTDRWLPKYNFTDKRVFATDFKLVSPEWVEDFYLLVDEETFQPVKEIFQGVPTKGEDTKKILWKEIRKAKVPLRVELHAPEQTLEKILEWKEGDLILLQEEADKPIKAYANGRPLLEGFLGKKNGFYALLFKNWYKED